MSIPYRFFHIHCFFSLTDSKSITVSSCCAPSLRRELKGCFRRRNEYVPPLQDHLQITLFTCLYMTLACASFLGVGPEANEEAFKWASSYPKIAKAISTIDLPLRQVEINNVATAVTCYMEENNASLEEASERLMKMVEDAWKDINHEYLNLTSLPTSLLMPYINLSRMMEILYRQCDKYTNVHLLNECVALRKSSIHDGRFSDNGVDLVHSNETLKMDTVEGEGDPSRGPATNT
ncbi:Alpha-humulene synthase [Ananas comosus]|uniref:Alpha-humulene synthase n=1 Tax=Ananas comosus TaxID=4615 RepID=A0A199VN89_ANACO|nr:Alpha-humulene synthase [Ananas comosus]